MYTRIHFCWAFACIQCTRRRIVNPLSFQQAQGCAPAAARRPWPRGKVDQGRLASTEATLPQMRQSRNSYRMDTEITYRNQSQISFILSLIHSLVDSRSPVMTACRAGDSSSQYYTGDGGDGVAAPPQIAWNGVPGEPRPSRKLIGVDVRASGKVRGGSSFKGEGAWCLWSLDASRSSSFSRSSSSYATTHFRALLIMPSNVTAARNARLRFLLKA